MPTKISTSNEVNAIPPYVPFVNSYLRQACVSLEALRSKGLLLELQVYSGGELQQTLLVTPDAELTIVARGEITK
mgnify:FL=1